jgi:exodeoxyribonuclease VII large subunit
VRAAAQLSKPFVSAIGHENDRPVLDDVADLRASTPTDAAKRVVPDVIEERRQLGLLRQRTVMRFGNLLLNQEQLLAAVLSRPVLASPYGFIDTQSEFMAVLHSRCQEIIGYRLERSSADLASLRARGSALSPQLTLSRGYSVVLDSKRNLLAATPKLGDKITILNSTAEITASVEKVSKRNG